MSKKSVAKKVIDKAKEDNERGARHELIEELFYDFHKSRKQVYLMNFIRGLFFGLGSVLGGTILVAIAIWIISQFVDWPGVGDYFESLRNTLESRPR
ncbi:hypothetical protein D3C85_1135490 [compost metagenome]